MIVSTYLQNVPKTAIVCRILTVIVTESDRITAPWWELRATSQPTRSVWLYWCHAWQLAPGRESGPDESSPICESVTLWEIAMKQIGDSDSAMSVEQPTGDKPNNIC